MEMRTKKVPRVEPGKAYDVGLGRPTLIDDCHTLPVSRIARYRLVDGEGVRGEMTPGHSRIATDYAPVSDGGAQQSVRTVGFGYDQKAGGLFIEPMDHTRAIGLTLGGQFAAPPEERVYERAGPISG